MIRIANAREGLEVVYGQMLWELSRLEVMPCEPTYLPVLPGPRSCLDIRAEGGGISEPDSQA